MRPFGWNEGSQQIPSYGRSRGKDEADYDDKDPESIRKKEKGRKS